MPSRSFAVLALVLGLATPLHAGALLAVGDAFPAWTLADLKAAR